ncbi:efflux RND transporter permease subunit [Spartinivicinus poritis]|uniref:Efflux RND transporter permease subunit n=1 Tax=Spartinivicinus poritis TaxID=2994640 RepID=A0ABT5UFT9_9GAMM|nr:efflux RND transporter permease subunit [Spartinivicinus sp. A2-2]MDE1465244.1 efflux RND transporter permease subunit [Spartinivicinus sp. A2-2]
MKLPHLAVVNYQFTLIVVLLMVVLGVVSLNTMPRSEDPQVTMPMATVYAVYPGTTPIDMEKLVLEPIEEAIYELEDVKVVKSKIEDGLVFAHVEFLDIEDPEDYYDDVVQAMASIRDDLPDELHRLEVLKISPSDVNIFLVSLLSETVSYRELKRYGEQLERQFERSTGVKQADVWAYPEQQVQVRADLEKMRELQISLDNLVDALEAASVNVPAGHVDAGTRRFTVRTSGDFKNLRDIRRTTVKAMGNQIVFVEDIAEISFADAEPTHNARYNGQRGILISVKQRENTNIFSVMKDLEATLANFQQKLPANIKAVAIFDQTNSVTKMINVLTGNLVQGLVLVGIIVFLVLGFKPSLVVVLAIPTSILIAIGLVDVSGFGLQQITIAGLVIALGLLVDNAIVIIENIGRLLKQNQAPFHAAVLGTQQMSSAVASGTITTLLAFLPMLMLQGPTGLFIQSLPVTVILTLSVSLIIALTLTPLLASRLLTKNNCAYGFSKKHCIDSKSANNKFFTKIYHGITTTNPIPKLINLLTHNIYGPLLQFSLKLPWLLLFVACLVFAASLTLFPKVGVSLFPKAEKPQLMVDIDTPEGTSFDKTQAIALIVEKRLLAHPQVISVTTNSGRGNPKVYYNVDPKRETPNHAQLFVQLKDDDKLAMPTLVTTFRQQFRDIPGAKIAVKEFIQGPPIDAPIAIWVIGDNINQLKQLSTDVEAIIKQTPGTVNVRNPTSNYRTDLKVNINRDKAGLLGIPLVTIDKTVRASLVGTSVGSMRDELGDEYSVVVKLADTDKPTMDDFDRVTVTGVTGNTVPLRHVATLEPDEGQATFRHLNLERSALITADVKHDYQVAELTHAIANKLDQIRWPVGMSYKIGGEEETRAESFAGITKALIVALLGIFAVLVFQFKSLSQPIIVFAAIPFAIIGTLVCLYATANSFSFMAFIGFSSLVGIVVNNSIILVDYANQLKNTGKSVVSAAFEAGITRLSPILLTTLTTVGGLLPLTLSGSSLWEPMGWTIIGGLLSSTVLTLFVVPVLYVLLTPKNALRTDKTAMGTSLSPEPK